MDGRMRRYNDQLEIEPFSLPNVEVLYADPESGITAPERAAKRRRIEIIGQRCLRGHQIFIQSATLKGPFDEKWVNPWVGNARNEYRDVGKTTRGREKADGDEVLGGRAHASHRNGLRQHSRSREVHRIPRLGATAISGARKEDVQTTASTPRRRPGLDALESSRRTVLESSGGRDPNLNVAGRFTPINRHISSGRLDLSRTEQYDRSGDDIPDQDSPSLRKSRRAETQIVERPNISGPGTAARVARRPSTELSLNKDANAKSAARRVDEMRLEVGPNNQSLEHKNGLSARPPDQVSSPFEYRRRGQSHNQPKKDSPDWTAQIQPADVNRRHRRLMTFESPVPTTKPQEESRVDSETRNANLENSQQANLMRLKDLPGEGDGGQSYKVISDPPVKPRQSKSPLPGPQASSPRQEQGQIDVVRGVQSTFASQSNVLPGASRTAEKEVAEAPPSPPDPACENTEVTINNVMTQSAALVAGNALHGLLRSPQGLLQTPGVSATNLKDAGASGQTRSTGEAARRRLTNLAPLSTQDLLGDLSPFVLKATNDHTSVPIPVTEPFTTQTPRTCAQDKIAMPETEDVGLPGYITASATATSDRTQVAVVERSTAGGNHISIGPASNGTYASSFPTPEDQGLTMPHSDPLWQQPATASQQYARSFLSQPGDLSDLSLSGIVPQSTAVPDHNRRSPERSLQPESSFLSESGQMAQSFTSDTSTQNRSKGQRRRAQRKRLRDSRRESTASQPGAVIASDGFAESVTPTLLTIPRESSKAESGILSPDSDGDPTVLRVHSSLHQAGSEPSLPRLQLDATIVSGPAANVIDGNSTVMLSSMPTPAQSRKTSLSESLPNLERRRSLSDLNSTPVKRWGLWDAGEPSQVSSFALLSEHEETVNEVLEDLDSFLEGWDLNTELKKQQQLKGALKPKNPTKSPLKSALKSSH